MDADERRRIRNSNSHFIISYLRSSASICGSTSSSLFDQQLSAAEGVLQEHRDGHRPHAAGHGGEETGFGFDRLEVDVAYGFLGAVRPGDAVDADVDHDGAV